MEGGGGWGGGGGAGFAIKMVCRPAADQLDHQH